MTKDISVDCGECHKILTEIKVMVDLSVKENVNLRKDFMKIVLALLALVGSNIGLKFLGTPFYLYIGVGSALFGGIFLACSVIVFKDELDFYEKWQRILVAAVVLYASILRIYFYRKGITIPQNFGLAQNVLYTVLVWFMIYSAWKYKPRRWPWSGMKERRKCVKEHNCSCGVSH